jgi:hypothetical protein
MYHVSPVEDGVPDYLEIIANPICYQDIHMRITNYYRRSLFSHPNNYAISTLLGHSNGD